VALVASLTTASHDPQVSCGSFETTLPAGLREPEELIDRGSFRLRRGGIHQMEIHATSVDSLTRGP
jgi:hypothetical protein